MSTSTRKKQRRKIRKETNKQKEASYKKQAWESGKLIEENHNNSNYSKEYTEELSLRLYDILKDISNYSDEMCLVRFRNLKKKIQDLLLLWSPDVEFNSIFDILQKSLESYWDDDHNKFKQNLKNILKNDR